MTRPHDPSDDGESRRTRPHHRKRRAFRPRVERLTGESGRLQLHDALARLRSRRLPVLLDSAGGVPRRFSLLAFDPLPDPAPASIRELRAFVQAMSVEGGDGLPPFFHGGFVGALAYDLGAVEERLVLPDEPWGFPTLVGGLYTDFLVRDHAREETWLVLADGEFEDGREPADARRQRVLDELATPAVARGIEPLGALVRHTSPDEHRRRIGAARDQIAAGEIYQANLAHRFTRTLRGDPIELYHELRRRHPAPYLGYLGWSDGALLSASPELLLQFGPEAEHDGRTLARTRPIKGTIARGRTPEEDRRLANRLLTSEKDLAELAMIVDLERNDLGRVAAPGGVTVEGFPKLESYATVHHLSADVAARPAVGVDAVDVLASLFPGGSITGAPKLRSMELIAELEREGRGFSYGSLGCLDVRGRAAFNILIRTLLWRPRPDLGGGAGEVAFRVGGGITWGSDPAAEDRETLVKGQALADTLAGAGLGRQVPSA